jgi:hypothetical protein
LRTDDDNIDPAAHNLAGWQRVLLLGVVSPRRDGSRAGMIFTCPDPSPAWK